MKIFEIVLHDLRPGKSPVTALEEQLNTFLTQHSHLQVVSTHINSLMTPAQPNAMQASEEASIAMFCRLFYNEEKS